MLNPLFLFSRTNYREGSVNCESLSKPVLISGLEGQNRAVDGDSVVVELLDEREWSAPSEVILEDEGYDKGDTLEEDGEKKKKNVKKEVTKCGVQIHS